MISSYKPLKRQDIQGPFHCTSLVCDLKCCFGMKFRWRQCHQGSAASSVLEPWIFYAVYYWRFANALGLGGERVCPYAHLQHLTTKLAVISQNALSTRPNPARSDKATISQQPFRHLSFRTNVIP